MLVFSLVILKSINFYQRYSASGEMFVGVNIFSALQIQFTLNQRKLLNFIVFTNEILL